MDKNTKDKSKRTVVLTRDLDAAAYGKEVVPKINQENWEGMLVWTLFKCVFNYVAMVNFHFLTENYRIDIFGDDKVWLLLGMDGLSEKVYALFAHSFLHYRSIDPYSNAYLCYAMQFSQVNQHSGSHSCPGSLTFMLH